MKVSACQQQLLSERSQARGPLLLLQRCKERHIDDPVLLQ